MRHGAPTDYIEQIASIVPKQLREEKKRKMNQKQNMGEVRALSARSGRGPEYGMKKAETFRRVVVVAEIARKRSGSVHAQSNS